jgi:hypothetical protein
MYIICAEKEVFDDIWGFPKNENGPNITVPARQQ